MMKDNLLSSHTANAPSWAGAAREGMMEDRALGFRKAGRSL